MSATGILQPILTFDADGVAIKLGQATMTGSLPVVIASNQSGLPLLSLPTGGNRIGLIRLVGQGDIPLDAADAASIPATTRGFLSMGVDPGGNALFVGLDGARRQLIAGAGTAGAPAGGVVSTQPVSVLRASTATTLPVAAAIVATTLLAANTARLGGMIWNNSTAPLLVKYGAGASLVSATVRIRAGEYFEFPEPVYSGIVTGIWTVAVGTALVTEMT